MTDFTRQRPRFLALRRYQKPDGSAIDRYRRQSISTAQGNLKKPLEQMVEDLSTYYEATYIPPMKEYDGSFRTIAVKTSRSGLRVQSKTGYFAVAPGTDERIRPFEVSLMKSLAEPTLPSDIAFHATVLRFGEMPDGNTNSLVLEIPFSALQVKEDVHTNLFSAQVALFAQIKDAVRHGCRSFWGRHHPARRSRDARPQSRSLPLVRTALHCDPGKIHARSGRHRPAERKDRRPALDASKFLIRARPSR